MPNKNDEENFYVGVEDSADLRKDVLEASKRVRGIMQRYEKLKEIMAKKILEIENLKKIISEMSRLNTKLQSAMPKTRVRIPKSPTKGKVVREEGADQLESLDKDLRDVEDKLSML